MASGGPRGAMMTSLSGSINPNSLFMPPAAVSSLESSHLPNHRSSTAHLGSSNHHLHHNSGGSSSGGSRSAESSPTTASGTVLQTLPLLLC